MIIRGLTVSLLFAVLAAPAYAQDSDPNPVQDNPDTRQTDQSEEDWRKSRKKRDSGDIFKDIVTNPNSQGVGSFPGGEVKAIDLLNPESRRHLNRQRAKALAGAEPGEPIDAAYEPSEEAKTDEYIAKQEARAWKEMVEEANSGLGGMGDGTGDGKSGEGEGTASQEPAEAGQGGGEGQTKGQAGQSGGGSSGQSPMSQNSPLRGGSAASASDILNQIKGRGAPSGQNPSGQTAGQSAGQAEGQAQGSQPSGQSDAQQGQDSGQAQTDGTADADAQSASDASAQAQADAAAAAQAQAVADAQSNAETAAQAAAHAETISPLERLKRDPVDRAGTGGRTSASDYLKKKQD
ncbi:hypothetical protein [Litorimonas sp. WD9-15]|uniref:hypothetical protein n=1 Tax=Litorimonas sp. WD9-15 TaxID=3418716 RepID=UPI003D06C3DB